VLLPKKSLNSIQIHVIFLLIFIGINENEIEMEAILLAKNLMFNSNKFSTSDTFNKRKIYRKSSQLIEDNLSHWERKYMFSIDDNSNVKDKKELFASKEEKINELLRNTQIKMKEMFSRIIISNYDNFNEQGQSKPDLGFDYFNIDNLRKTNNSQAIDSQNEISENSITYSANEPTNITNKIDTNNNENTDITDRLHDTINKDNNI